LFELIEVFGTTLVFERQMHLHIDNELRQLTVSTLPAVRTASMLNTAETTILRKRDFAFALVGSMQNCSNVLNTTMVRVDEELQMVRAILQSYDEEADSFLGMLKGAYCIIVPICPYIDWDALDRLQEARQRDLDEYSTFLQKWNRVLNRYIR